MHHHFRTAGAQTTRDRGANPAARAGDEANLARDFIEAHLTSPVFRADTRFTAGSPTCPVSRNGNAMS